MKGLLSMTQFPQKTGKNYDIEILRGFAILFTVALHCTVLLPSTYFLPVVLQHFDLSVGVDLFLVISGYVITGSVLESMRCHYGTKHTLLFAFWIKRIYRLLPAAWAWVVLAFLCQMTISFTTDTQYDLQDSLIRVAAALSNTMNLYMPYCIANAGAESCILENYLGHYWSLSLEEQFYIVLPLLLLFVAKRFLIALLVVVVLIQFMWFRPFFSFAWYLKSDALCWGVLLALFSKTHLYRICQPKIDANKYIYPLAGLAVLILLPLIGSRIQGVGHDMQPYGVATVAAICACIVWMATFEGHIYNIGGLYSKIMLYFGSRSYSLYLSHLIVFSAARDFGERLSESGSNESSIVSLCVPLILALLSSELTYRFIETKFRSRGRHIAEKMMSTRYPR